MERRNKLPWTWWTGERDWSYCERPQRDQQETSRSQRGQDSRGTEPASVDAMTRDKSARSRQRTSERASARRPPRGRESAQSQQGGDGRATDMYRDQHRSTPGWLVRVETLVSSLCVTSAIIKVIMIRTAAERYFDESEG